MELLLKRGKFTGTHTPGSFYVDDDFLGYTCEDEDRFLESGGQKIRGQTAIPRGRYKVGCSQSKRFGRLMLEILGVPGFTGVRIHGGNTAADTDGCPLLGAERTATGVHNCADINAHLVELVRHALAAGEEVWITVE